MEPTFLERGDIHVVGLNTCVGTGGEPDGTETWRRFRAAMHDVPGRIGAHAFGVIEVVDKDAGTFTYWAAVEVASEGSAPRGLKAKTLEGGRFAVFTLTLATPDIANELKQAFGYIYGIWLPRSNVDLRAFYDIEYYDDRFDPKRTKGAIDIWVPVK